VGAIQGEGSGDSDSIAVLHVWPSSLRLSASDDFLGVLNIAGFLGILGIILWKIDWREWGIVGLGIVPQMLLQTFTLEKAFRCER